MKKANLIRGLTAFSLVLALGLGLVFNSSLGSMSASADYEPDNYFGDWSDSKLNVDDLINPLPSYEEYTDPDGDYAYVPDFYYVTLPDYSKAWDADPVQAAQDYPQGREAKQDYYRIRIDDAAQLKELSRICNDLSKNEKREHFLQQNFVLGDNIDYGKFYGEISVNLFMPIGYGYEKDVATDIEFNGTFDGQGFEIKGLALETAIPHSKCYYGMFGCVGVDGIIENLGLIDPIIDTTAQNGGMHTSALVGKNRGTVRFVFVDDYCTVDILNDAIDNDKLIGYLAHSGDVSGLVAFNTEEGTIDNVYYSGALTTAKGANIVDTSRALVAMNDGVITNAWYNSDYCLLPAEPQGTGTGAPVGVPEADLYKRGKSVVGGTSSTADRFEPQILNHPKWRLSSYEFISNIKDHMRRFPRLQGFVDTRVWSTDNRVINSAWGTTAIAAFRIINPADLVYFSRYVSNDFQGEYVHTSVTTSKFFHIAKCIDMSGVSPKAYKFSDEVNMYTARFEGTYDGLLDGTVYECDCVHHDNNTGVKNHSIINMSFGTGYNKNLGNDQYTNTYIRGLVPWTSSTIEYIQNLNIIGGDLIPEPIVEARSKFLLLGPFGGQVATKNRANLHSSMRCVMPDGAVNRFHLGGLFGWANSVSSGTFKDSSFSGEISGGIHPWGWDEPELAILFPNRNYSVGGLVGLGASAAATMAGEGTASRLMNFSNVYGTGFYKDDGSEITEADYTIPVDKDGYAVSGCGVGGIYGMGVGTANNLATSINFGDIYSFRVDEDGNPVKSEEGYDVYAVSQSQAGLYAAKRSTAGAAADTIAQNRGNIYANNLVIRALVGGAMASDKFSINNYVANLGNIVLKNCAGTFHVAGGTAIYRVASASSASVYIYNYGDITIDDSNKPTVVEVMGASSHAYSTETSSAIYEQHNYGDIYIDIDVPSTSMKVAGVTITSSSSSSKARFYNAGNITVKSTQTSAGSADNVITISGIGAIMSDTSLQQGGVAENSVNTGDVTVYMPNQVNNHVTVSGGARARMVNSLNSGNIHVVVNTSKDMYVGGVTARLEAPLLTNSVNLGDIYAENLYEGGGDKEYSTTYVGGVSGYKVTDMEGCTNAGNVTAKSGANTRVYLGGVVGVAPPIIINCINYGDVAYIVNSTEKGTTNSVYKLAGGVAGKFELYSAVSGLVNHGNVSSDAREGSGTAANTMTVGGITGYASSLNSTTVKTSFMNCINYGNVTGNYSNYIGSIAGRNHLNTKTSASANSPHIVKNLINATADLHTFGIINAPSAAVYNHTYISNIFTGNPADRHINAAAPNNSNPFNQKLAYVKLTSDDETCLYHEDFVVNTDSDNPNTLKYYENGDLYESRMMDPRFEYGMYVVSSGNDLPNNMRIGLIDPVSMKKDSDPAVDVSTDWRTANKRDADGAEVSDSSVTVLYDRAQQLNALPKISFMGIKSDPVGTSEGANNYLPEQNMPVIQKVNVRDKKVTFYWPPNLQGREFYAIQALASKGVVSAFPDTLSAPEDIKINLRELDFANEYLKENYRANPENYACTTSVWIHNYNGDEPPIEWTVEMALLPEITLELVNVNSSLYNAIVATDAPIYHSAPTYRQECKVGTPELTQDMSITDRKVYDLNVQPYWGSSASNYGILIPNFRAVNLEPTVNWANYVRIYDEIGDDVTAKFSLRNGSSTFSYTYSTILKNYIYGTNTLAPTIATLNASLFVSTSYAHALTIRNDTTVIPDGQYTYVVEMEGERKFSIRFNYKNNPLPRIVSSTYGVLDIDAENRVGVETSVMPYGLPMPASLATDYASWPFQLPNPTKATLYGRAAYKQNATEAAKLLTNVKETVLENGDIEHELTTHVLLTAPNGESSNGTKQWWKVVHKDSPKNIIIELSKFMINGSTREEDFLVLQKYAVPETVSWTSKYIYAMMTNANQISFKVEYKEDIDAAWTPENTLTLDLRAGAAAAGPFTYMLDGVNMLQVSTKANGNTNGSTFSVPANTPPDTSTVTPASNPSKTYDYTVLSTTNTASGQYRITPVFKLTTEVQVTGGYVNNKPKELGDNATYDAFKTPTKVNYQASLETIIITKPLGSDSYASNIQFPQSAFKTIECKLCEAEPETHAKHHASSAVFATGRINYGMLNTSDVESIRCNDFDIVVYFEKMPDELDYEAIFTIPRGAKLYYQPAGESRYDSPVTINTAEPSLSQFGDWKLVKDANKPQYDFDVDENPDPEDIKYVRYMVVSGDGTRATFYNVQVSTLPRNKTFAFRGYGDGVNVPFSISNNYNTTYPEAIFLISAKKIDDTGEISEIVNGTFLPYVKDATGNPVNILLPSKPFPLFTAGTYILEVTCPPGFTYTIGQGLKDDGSNGKLDPYTRIEGTDKWNLVVDNPSQETTVNIDIQFSKIK